MKKVSVIVPVYKVENYLERCIRSLVRQTYQNLEILLVDDGSPDRCPEICDMWAGLDDRIKVIHKENGGLSSARNVGMDAATGDYLFFVDSDDWIDPPILALLVNLCERHGAQIGECSYRNWYQDHIDEETSCSGRVIEARPIEAIRGNLEWKNFKPVAWNKLYRADITKGIRYPLGKLHEDEFATHKFYLAASKIVYVDCSGYNYDRRREDSITATYSPKNLDACEAFHEKVHLVWETPELHPLASIMGNNYCYLLFTQLVRCYDAGLTGSAECARTISDALSDFPLLQKCDLNPRYKQCFAELEKGKIEDVVRIWKGSVT